MAVTGKVFLKVKLEKHWKVHLDNGHISSDAILEFNQARLPRFFRSPLSDAIFTYQRRNDVGRTVASDIADSDDIEQQAINGDGDYSMEDHFIQDGLTDDDSEDDDLEEEGGDPFPQGRIDILKENEKDWGIDVQRLSGFIFVLKRVHLHWVMWRTPYENRVRRPVAHIQRNMEMQPVYRTAVVIDCEWDSSDLRLWEVAIIDRATGKVLINTLIKGSKPAKAAPLPKGRLKSNPALEAGN
ncbi:hypothetical protein FPOAC2_01624 [Fusarium poae]